LEYIFTENGQKYWNEFIDENADEVRTFLYNSSEQSIIACFSQYINGKFIEKLRVKSIISNAMDLENLEANLGKLKSIIGGESMANIMSII